MSGNRAKRLVKTLLCYRLTPLMPSSKLLGRRGAFWVAEKPIKVVSITQNENNQWKHTN